MENRSARIIISVLIVIAMIATVLQLLNINIGYVPLVNLLFVIKLIIVSLIVREGTFIKSTIYTTAAGVCAAIITIGSLFKIMHWPGGNVMLMIGFSLLIVIYSLWSALKKEKAIMDYVKWIWVVALCLSLMYHIFHWPMREVFAIAQEGAFIAMMSLYLTATVKEQRESM